MKIVFFGTDAFSVRALEACLDAGASIALVITTPAQKKGRGLHLEPSLIFDFCKPRNLSVEAYAKLKVPEVREKILALRPDLFVAASYGKLIPKGLLGIPKCRLNVHPSLVPKYRGAAPMHWPILNGDEETGVSIIDIGEKLDAGVVYAQERFVIRPRMNAVELGMELSELSYRLLKQTLAKVQNGTLKGIPQDESKVTLAPQLKKEDGKLTFDQPAEILDRKVRGLKPWPGTFFFLRNERVAVLQAEAAKMTGDEKPGTVLSFEQDGSVAVATTRGAFRLIEVKPEGKKAMCAIDLANGRHLKVGERILP